MLSIIILCSLKVHFPLAVYLAPDKAQFIQLPDAFFRQIRQTQAGRPITPQVIYPIPQGDSLRIHIVFLDIHITVSTLVCFQCSEVFFPSLLLDVPYHPDAIQPADLFLCQRTRNGPAVHTALGLQPGPQRIPLRCLILLRHIQMPVRPVKCRRTHKHMLPRNGQRILQPGK